MTAQSPTSPLNAVVRRAGEKLASLQMTEIAKFSTATKDDAESLIDDLTIIAGIVDEMIAEIGDYAAEHFDMTLHDRDYGFKDLLYRALDGEGLHLIESACDDMHERMREAAE